MNRLLTILCLLLLTTQIVRAQDTFNQIDEQGNVSQRNTNFNVHNKDTTKTNKEIPKVMRVWTVDRKFGNVMPTTPDTLHHLYMNTTLNTGRYGEYNTTATTTPRASAASSSTARRAVRSYSPTPTVSL
jgi:hypothetical protein